MSKLRDALSFVLLAVHLGSIASNPSEFVRTTQGFISQVQLWSADAADRPVGPAVQGRRRCPPGASVRTK
jgi:hypothetical protein